MLFKRNFLNIYSKPETIKFALNITRTTESAQDDNKVKEPREDGFNRSFIFRNGFCKIFCPILLYKSDIRNESKASPNQHRVLLTAAAKVGKKIIF